MKRRSFLAFLGVAIPATALAKQAEAAAPATAESSRFVFHNGWEELGSITVSGTLTEYVTSSDPRMMGEA